MRILHTSDWHLGADYFQRPRLTEQRRFLGWLQETLRHREVDVLVVAGDVFDTPQPPAEAQALYYGFLAELARHGRTQVVIVGGNHDSAARLEAPRHLLAALSVHVVAGFVEERRAEPRGDPAGRLVKLERETGAGVVVAAVPYLHDWHLGVRSFEGDEAMLRQQVSSAFADVYRRLADVATAEFPGLPLIATGHLTCLPRAGDQPGEQDAVPEPINRVGTIGALGPAIFDERFAHVALGHLHRSFPIGAARRIWYSGTPVQVSAAEPADARVVLLVDVDPSGARVEPLAVPVTRRLTKVAGELDVVRAGLSALEWPDQELPPYVLADVVLSEHRPRLREELQDLLREGPEGRPQLVEVRARAAVVPGRESGAALPSAEELTPELAFRFAWSVRHQGTAPPDAVMRRFLSLLEGRADG